MPLPWWTSQSTIATRSEPERDLGVARGDRGVVEEAEAHRPAGERVVAGRAHERERILLDGRDRRPGREQRRLVARRGADRVRVEPGLAFHASHPVDVLREVRTLDLLGGRRPSELVVGERPEQDLEPGLRLRVAARRVEVGQVGMGDDLHVAPVGVRTKFTRRR